MPTEKLISDYTITRVESGCAPVSGKYGLQINTPNDITPVFPYLNALLEETRYDLNNGILIWKEGDSAYALRPHEIIIASERGLDEPQVVRSLVKGIIDRINNTWANKDSIEPCFTEKTLPSVIDFYKLLPKTNCKKCGRSTCLVFAADLREGKNTPGKCLPLLESQNEDNRRKLETLINQLPERKK